MTPRHAVGVVLGSASLWLFMLIRMFIRMLVWYYFDVVWLALPCSATLRFGGRWPSTQTIPQLAAYCRVVLNANGADVCFCMNGSAHGMPWAHSGARRCTDIIRVALVFAVTILIHWDACWRCT